jgi:SAM-dependent methyltransferase
MNKAFKTSIWNKVKRFRRMSKQDHVNFWVKDELKNIIPPGTDNPAGWDEAAFLQELTLLLTPTSVLEIGCGWGRLCEAFDAAIYTGVDINPKAVEKAMGEHPGYRFQALGYDDDYPKADLCMVYTVLLHVDDQFIESVVERIRKCCDRVLVVEILGRQWRATSKKVPVFNRDRENYVKLFSGYTLEMEIKKPYRRYQDTDISFLYFVKTETSNA